MEKTTNYSTIHIGIVAYNSLLDLKKCLESIYKQSYSPIKIYLFDNNSRDKVMPWLLAQNRSIKYYQSKKNIGFGKAHNHLIKKISFKTNDYYMLLNPDVILTSSYLEELLFLLKKQGADWGTGKIYSLKKKNTFYSVGHALRRDGFAFNIGYGLKDLGQFNKPRQIFGCPATASLISFKLIKKVSKTGDIFDKRMFMYNEDTDLDWRARLLGLKCWYCPKAIAYHKGNQPSEKLKLESIGNRYISVIKNGFPIDLIFYNLPIILGHCLFRIIVTPSQGLKLFLRLLWVFITTFFEKKTRRIPRHKILFWFSWSKYQQTRQPVTYSDRLKKFFKI